MKTTIDAAGRLVIPADVRRAAGLEPGMPLDVRFDDGAVLIEPATTPVTMKRRGRFLVAQASRAVPALTERTVQASTVAEPTTR